MNVRHRVESAEAERDELTVMLGGGKTPPQAQAAQSLRGGRWGGCDAGDCPDRQCQPLHRRPDEAPFRGRQSGAGLERGAVSGRRAKSTARRRPAGGDRMRQAAAAQRWTLTLLAERRSSSTDQRQPVGRDVRRRLAENDPQAMAQGTAADSPMSMANTSPHGGRARSTPRRRIRLAAGPLRRDPVRANRRGAPAGPAEPGQRERDDHAVSPRTAPSISSSPSTASGWRNVKVTDRCAAVDYAERMRDRRRPTIRCCCIRASCRNICSIDNWAPYEAFAPAEGSTHPAPPRFTSLRNTPVGRHGRARDQRAAAPVSRPLHRRSEGSRTKSQHGNGGETKPEPASMDVTTEQSPAPNSVALIQRLRRVEITVTNDEPDLG